MNITYVSCLPSHLCCLTIIGESLNLRGSEPEEFVFPHPAVCHKLGAFLWSFSVRASVALQHTSKMLIEESYKDVPTKADGNGTMRMCDSSMQP
jgi:hypothetical protein